MERIGIEFRKFQKIVVENFQVKFSYLGLDSLGANPEINQGGGWLRCQVGSFIYHEHYHLYIKLSITM